MPIEKYCYMQWWFYMREIILLSLSLSLAIFIAQPISYLCILHNIISYLILSCLILSYLILSYLILSRRDYTNFRISNHNLIEYGRYGDRKTPRENRRCLLCKLNHVESERHLSFHMQLLQYISWKIRISKTLPK